jgi:VIT1/CCC1 family predicted Fe2+/Mn2+ transporter
MNKDLNKLFEEDNKRIDDAIQTQLKVKINKTIKNRRLLKGVILLLVTLIGAAIFSWSLSLLIP